MNFPTEIIVGLIIQPTEQIDLHAAVTTDRDGLAHHLIKPGEPFRGFAIERRGQDREDGKLSVQVQPEGFIALDIPGFTGTEMGRPVVCAGLHSYALDSKKGATAIGYIVGMAGPGKAWVKFQASKI